MNIQDIRILYQYNYWANHKILESSARVSQDQFIAPTGHSYGSLRGTLVHLLDAEYGWRMLCQHNALTGFDSLTDDNFPGIDSLAQRWQNEETAMRGYLSGLTDEDLVGYVRYTTDEGHKRERLLWHCLLHLANHGTQHRSEAADILTGYGCSPGDLDFTLFLNEMG
jgi:uncharacterized damage-inducible protein DinB